MGETYAVCGILETVTSRNVFREGHPFASRRNVELALPVTVRLLEECRAFNTNNTTWQQCSLAVRSSSTSRASNYRDAMSGVEWEAFFQRLQVSDSSSLLDPIERRGSTVVG